MVNRPQWIAELLEDWKAGKRRRVAANLASDLAGDDPSKPSIAEELFGRLVRELGTAEGKALLRELRRAAAEAQAEAQEGEGGR